MSETAAGSGRLPGPALLFCPADRPERYAKAAAAADIVVLDLEDAVSPAGKATARASLVASQLDPGRTIVRINPTGTGHHRDDLAAVEQTGYRTVMLAKAESDAQVRALGQWRVVALCETPRGVLDCARIGAAANTVALMWGAEDLAAAMGGTTSRTAVGSYRDFALHARSRVLLAAKAHGKQAIDAVFIDFRDLAGLAAEADDAAASGFDLKACIHPSQAEVVRRSYHPTEAQLSWARSVLRAAADGGVTSVGGQMIDAPLVLQARQIARRAGDERLAP